MLGALQASGDTLQDQVLAPEGRHGAVGTVGREEVRLPPTDDIITWREGGTL